MLSNGRVWTVPLKVTLLVPRGRGCFLSHQVVLLYLGTDNTSGSRLLILGPSRGKRRVWWVGEKEQNFSVLAMSGPLWREVASCQCFSTGGPPLLANLYCSCHRVSGACSSVSEARMNNLGLWVSQGAVSPQWPPCHCNLCYCTSLVTTVTPGGCVLCFVL